MSDSKPQDASGIESLLHQLADHAYKRLLALRRRGHPEFPNIDAEDLVIPLIKEVSRIHDALRTKPSDSDYLLAIASDLVIQLTLLLIRADALELDIRIAPPPDLTTPRLVIS